MTDRAVPFALGEGTCLRFDRADIKAIENELGVGYSFFTRPGIFGSLNATEAFVWRGLKKETEKGELVHAFALNEKGKEVAGAAVWEYFSNNDPANLNNAIVEAFIAAGPWKRRASDEKTRGTASGEQPPKNSTP
jgi:hypothetical protein